MTRYPKSRPYTPPHDCDALRYKYDETKKQWVCEVCGEPYIAPLQKFHVAPPIRLAFFPTHPWNCTPPDLKGSKGHCNGEFILEPGDKVFLKDIKASVTVHWEPWKDYSNGR